MAILLIHLLRGVYLMKGEALCNINLAPWVQTSSLSILGPFSRQGENPVFFDLTNSKRMPYTHGV
jgi:hypothetical protein